ncbi:MAG: amino acid permease [Frondihabitans sp.]|nr:amino acid permease [Frondihabitans sp.]
MSNDRATASFSGAPLVPPPDSNADENTRLAEFGYKQRLDRSVGKWASFAIGFSAISATTAVFSSFGAGYFTAGSPFVWTLFLAVGVFFVWALIAADLAAKIPLAGYAYQWTSRINGSHLGWFTGSVALIGWISGMVGVAYTFAGYFGTLFGWNESNQAHIFLTVAVIIVCMLINAFGIRLTTLINNIGVSLELVVTVAATIIVGVIAFLVPSNHQPLSTLFTGGTSSGGTPYALAWFAAALGPFFGLIGVEASADVAEETKGARRVIPRTMFMALAVSSVIELLMYLVYVLAIRDPHAVNAATAAPIAEIIREQAGPVFSRILVAVALTNILVCLLANMLVATRLTYSMSRDNMLPFSRTLRHVSPRHKTPANAVFTLGAVAILLCLSALFNASAFIYFLNIASLAFFGVYVLQTAGLIVGHRRGTIPQPETGTFDLGRARMPVYIIGIIVFVIVEFALIALPQFAGNGWVFLGILVVAGLWWLVAVRRRLRRGDAGPRYAVEHPEEFPEA